jgi:hypothetical protein
MITVIKSLRRPLLLGAICSLSLVGLGFGFERNQPEYASEKTKEIIGKVMMAHGDLTKWLKAPSMSYDFVMHLPSIEKMTQGRFKGWQVWRAKQTTIQPGSKQVYVDLPWEKKAQLASDGKKIWSVGYERNSPVAMPPLFTLWHHASFVNIPWLMMDERIRLGEPKQGMLPNDSKEYIVIRITNERNGQLNPEKYYDIYIDPESYLIKANAYNMAFLTLPDSLWPEQPMPFPGTMLRVIDDYTTVDGLTVPSKYSTTDMEGKTLFGSHLLLNISFSKTFDRSRMMMPSNAVVAK